MNRAELIGRAQALCIAVGRPGLAKLLEPEPSGRAARILVVGPVSSGKSSTIVSLIGTPALVDGVPLLPIGVEPVTAQLTMIETGQPTLSLSASRDDGTVLTETSPEQIRKILTDGNNPFRVSQLSLPGAARLSGWTWLDAPGLGRAGEEVASVELVTLGIAAADLILLHVDVLRGLGRAKPVLDVLVSVVGEQAALIRRLVPVLTNVRSEGRANEVEEQLGELFPGIARAVRVPRRGDTTMLEQRLEAWRVEHGTARNDELRLDEVLRMVVAPELERTLVAARDPGLADEIAHLEASVAKARVAVEKLVTLSADARVRLTADLSALAVKAERETQQAVGSYADQASRLTPQAAQREVSRTVTYLLQEKFGHEVKATQDGCLDALHREAAELIHAFDAEVVTPLIARRAPGFESVVQHLGVHGGHQGVQFAVAALGRSLGGNSRSVILATQNAVRMAAARSFRAVTGEKLARETVQRVIPRLVRPLGETLKFLANNQVAVAVLLEVGFLAWTVYWARDKARSAGNELVDQWRDGVDPSMFAKAKSLVGLPSVPPSLPVRTQLEDHVNGIWDGVALQLASWLDCVNRTAAPWEEELTSLRVIGERHAELEKRWRELEQALSESR